MGKAAAVAVDLGAARAVELLDGDDDAIEVVSKLVRLLVDRKLKKKVRKR